jgi:hypothetical protein
MPETPTDLAIREEGERLRRAFPFLDERPCGGWRRWPERELLIPGEVACESGMMSPANPI